MELQGGSSVESGITERVEGMSRITGRVEGREWNYMEGQG